MILGINTAQRLHELALIDEQPDGSRKLIAEQRWADERRDVEDLAPFLKALLEEHGLEKSEIKQVVVVSGPGSFTSLRTGVAFANALAEGLGARLYAMDTFELLTRKAAAADPVLAVIHAGGLDVGVKLRGEAVRVGPLAAVLNDYPHDHSIRVVSELTETESEELHPIVLEKEWQVMEGHELLSLGEMLTTLGLEGLKVTSVVEPVYLKAPNITKSADKWKN